MSQASLKTHHAVSLGDMQSPLLLLSTALTPLHMIGYEVITIKLQGMVVRVWTDQCMGQAYVI